MNNGNCLIIFLRSPKLGKVKTRIATSIGNEKALAVYNELVTHTFNIIADLNCTKYLFFADESISGLNVGFDYQIQFQQGDNIGERMKNSFAYCFDRGYKNVVLIGSDIYEITSEIIVEAFEKLKSSDCVIGPAEDGGYYLLGLTKNYPVLFEDIEWSTDRTLIQTIEILEKEKLSYHTQITLNDVDTLEDILRYRKLKRIIGI